jgi:hypothetical protein
LLMYSSLTLNSNSNMTSFKRFESKPVVGIEMVLCECGLMVWLPQGKNEVLHKKNFGLATDRQRPLQTVVNCEVSEVLLWHTWRPAISKHAKPS